MLMIMNWLKYKFLIIDNQIEFFIGIIALLFTVLGIWVANKLIQPKTKTVVVEKEIIVQKNLNFVINEYEIKERNISKRELEVLELMSEGLSNQEIADRLFVSLNTIKTHSSNLFSKLEVKSRTQALEKAKKLEILP